MPSSKIVIIVNFVRTYAAFAHEKSLTREKRINKTENTSSFHFFPKSTHHISLRYI